jgi:CheY-like chemotaxis protein
VDRERTKEAGFDAHLTKPAKYETLVEVLNHLPSNDQIEIGRHREL